MTFAERMKDILDQGVAVSRDFAVKAGAIAQDLGEKGVLMVEIKQLESQAQKLIGRLGNEAYAVFAEERQETLSANRVQVKLILDELAKVRESIEKKEAELKNKRAN